MQTAKPYSIHNHASRLIALAVITLLSTLLGACRSAPPPPPQAQPADELILYYWPDYFPASVLDDFAQKYNVKIRYEAFASHEEAVAKIIAGNVYDVVIMAPEYIPQLVSAGALAKINYQAIPNFMNVSPNFRDLVYDPNNVHSIPYHWGTTGLLVRTDLVKQPITRWADLWDPKLAGKVALWPIPRALIPIALKKLGYPANSEDPQELEEALQELIKLKKNSFFISNLEPSVVPTLESGKAAISFGWTYDLSIAEQAKAPIAYILPEEGTLLWGENYIVPASSPHPDLAAAFLNYVLDPEVAAKIIGIDHSAVPNEGALKLIPAELRNNQNLFPPPEMLQNAELTLPLSPEGQKLWDQVWERLLAD